MVVASCAPGICIMVCLFSYLGGQVTHERSLEQRAVELGRSAWWYSLQVRRREIEMDD